MDLVRMSVVVTFGSLMDGSGGSGSRSVITFDLGPSAACSAGSLDTDPVGGRVFLEASDSAAVVAIRVSRSPYGRHMAAGS